MLVLCWVKCLYKILNIQTLLSLQPNSWLRQSMSERSLFCELLGIGRQLCYRLKSWVVWASFRPLHCFVLDSVRPAGVESLGSFHGGKAASRLGNSTAVKRSWEHCLLQFLDANWLHPPMFKRSGFSGCCLMSSLVTFAIETILLYLSGK